MQPEVDRTGSRFPYVNVGHYLSEPPFEGIEGAYIGIDSEVPLMAMQFYRDPKMFYFVIINITGYPLNSMEKDIQPINVHRQLATVGIRGIIRLTGRGRVGIRSHSDWHHL